MVLLYLFCQAYILIISTKEAVIITLSLWLITFEINRSAVFTPVELWGLNILSHFKNCVPDWQIILLMF